MDNVSADSVLFLEYHGGASPDEVTIIPVHLQLNFLAAFRQGVGSRNGHSQEYAGKWLHPFGLEMGKCQKVKGENQKVGSDEFIDSLCSPAVRGLINHVSLMRSDWYKLKFRDYQTPANRNVWNTFQELEQSFSLLCAGIEIKHPQTRIEDGRVVMAIKQRKDAINIDFYCDNKQQELDNIHPKLILESPEKMEAVRKEVAKQTDPGNNLYHYAGRLLVWESWWPGRPFDLNLVSPFLTFLSLHYPYREICRQQFPELTEAEVPRCAMVLSYFKNHDDYDNVRGFDRAMFGYPDPKISEEPLWMLRRFANRITYAGLLLHLLKIEVNPSLLLWAMAILNFLLLLPSLYMPFNRYGTDFMAYVN